MKRTVTIMSIALAIGAFITGTVLPTESHAQMAQKDRLALMKSLGGSMQKLKKASDTKTMIEAAKVIQSSTQKLTADNLWPKGSHGGETRAKMEIWQNMGDFKAKMKDTNAAAANLIKVAMGGNLGAAKGAFGGVGRTCGACHKVYRTPKKK